MGYFICILLGIVMGILITLLLTGGREKTKDNVEIVAIRSEKDILDRLAAEKELRKELSPEENAKLTEERLERFK